MPLCNSLCRAKFQWWCDLCSLFFLSIQINLMIQISLRLIIWAPGKPVHVKYEYKLASSYHFFHKRPLFWHCSCRLAHNIVLMQSQSNQLNIYSTGSYKRPSASFSLLTSLMAHRQNFDNSGIQMHKPCNTFIGKNVTLFNRKNIYFIERMKICESECK